MLNELLAMVTVIKFALFLVVVRAFTLVPPFSGSNVTAAPVVSNKEPLISIVASPPSPTSTTADVTSLPPSSVILVIVGGESIGFQSVPS